MTQIRLDQKERLHLTGVLASTSWFQDQGLRGRRVLLQMAGVWPVVSNIDFSGPALPVASDVVGRLERFGALPEEPSTHALGALLRQLLSFEDLTRQAALTDHRRNQLTDGSRIHAH